MATVDPPPTEAEWMVGRVVTSDTDQGVSYELGQPLGVGGMATVYAATRRSADGTAPAVVKVMDSQLGSQVGSAGHTALTKEVVALGRLDEQIPRTPFVVRLLDVGTIEQTIQGYTARMPWLALEHVFGGPEGTTLEERVEHSVENTGYAFDTVRALRVVRAVAWGLGEVHAVGVIHRDIKPANVLCCGHGSSEVFKIADFGIARSVGMHATFGSAGTGTPGYAPPEQLFPDSGDIGAWSDVFAVAATLFFVLTGEDYFDAPNAPRALMIVRAPERRSLLDCPKLAPDFRANPGACRAIDAALAQATSSDTIRRPATVKLLTGFLEAALDEFPPSTAVPLMATIAAPGLLDLHLQVTWAVRHPPGDSRVVHQVAWSEDGSALAATSAGLEYWSGTDWRPLGATPVGSVARAVCQIRPGAWFLAAPGGRAATYLTGGRELPLPECPGGLPFTRCDGDPEDIALLVAEPPGSPPLLVAVTSRRWMKPLPLPDVSSVNDICRLGDQRWLICGRTVAGGGFAAIYSPLQFELNRVVEARQALLSCCGDRTGTWAILGGRDGETYRLGKGRLDVANVPGEASLTCASIDHSGKVWAGSAGRIFESSESDGGRWTLAWEDKSWLAPFRSLHGNVGLLYAMTADGAVLEGRGRRL